MYAEDAPRNLKIPISCVLSNTAAYLAMITQTRLAVSPTNSSSDITTSKTFTCRARSVYLIPTSVKINMTSKPMASTLRQVRRGLWRIC